MKLQNFFLVIAIVALTSAPLFAQTEVSGNIESQIWTSDGNPYILIGDVVLQEDHMLTIGPGVEVYGDYGVRLLIEGKISAVGTDLNPIIFSNNDDGFWDGIELNNAKGVSEFIWCVFEEASTFHGRINGGAFNIRYSKVKFEYCLCQYNDANENAAALYGAGADITVFESKFIFNGSGGVSTIGHDVGGSMSLSYCLIASNSADLGSAICFYPAEYVVDHCTIVGNSGTPFYAIVPVTITNSIIMPEPGYELGGGDNITYEHCTIPDGLGINGNGMVYDDPAFVDEGNMDFNLQVDSPCIDAGDPEFDQDEDGTITDIGSYAFTQLVNSAGDLSFRENPIDFELATCYPNPFNPSTTLILNLEQSVFVSIRIYDRLGREVAQQQSDLRAAGRHEFKWNAEGLPSGNYFAVVSAGELTEVVKMVLLK